MLKTENFSKKGTLVVNKIRQKVRAMKGLTCTGSLCDYFFDDPLRKAGALLIIKERSSETEDGFVRSSVITERLTIAYKTLGPTKTLTAYGSLFRKLREHEYLEKTVRNNYGYLRLTAKGEEFLAADEDRLAEARKQINGQ